MQNLDGKYRELSLKFELFITYKRHSLSISLMLAVDTYKNKTHNT
jgi:hypothetical protein